MLLKIRFVKNEIESVLHHAFLQLYHIKDFDVVNSLFLGCTDDMNLNKYGIDVGFIKGVSYQEEQSGEYEHVLKEMDKTCGSYTALFVVQQLYEQLKEEADMDENIS